MRYEAKHNYLKMVQNIGNFINIAWTLAMRHQCYYGISADGLFEISDEVEPGILNCMHEAITGFMYTTIMYRGYSGLSWTARWAKKWV